MPQVHKGLANNHKICYKYNQLGLTANRLKRNNGYGTGIKRGCAVMEIRLMDSEKLLLQFVKVFLNPSKLKLKKV